MNLFQLPHHLHNKICVTDTCWNWQAYKNADGYGRVGWKGNARQAHRVIYTLLVGEIAEGMLLDHLCRNRGCVNPLHMEEVTQEENTKRGFPGIEGRRKTHCPKGHFYSKTNTHITRQGSRSCKKCERAATRAWRQKNRVA